MVGGTAALIGAACVGPRIGRFDDKGKPVTIEGHTVPVFYVICLFCSFVSTWNILTPFNQKVPLFPLWTLPNMSHKVTFDLGALQSKSFSTPILSK